MKRIIVNVSDEVIEAILLRLYADHMTDSAPHGLITAFTKTVLAGIDEGKAEIIINLSEKMKSEVKP